MQALANSSQRRNLLQELFADIALEVDDRAKGELLMVLCMVHLVCMLMI